MADAPNFDDQKSFDAWLDSFDDETTLAYAQVLSDRVALRVVPFLEEIWSYNPDLKPKSNLTLHSLRANLLSAVARKYRTADNKKAAFSADSSANSIFSAAYHAVFPIDFAYLSARCVTGYARFAIAAVGASYSLAFSADFSSIWKSVREDVEALDQGMRIETLETQRLWLGNAPEWFIKTRNDFRRALKADGPHWDFWLDWYAAKISGEPMDRLSIQGEDFIGQKLAEQDQAFWDRGPEAVSADIEAWIEEWDNGVSGSRQYDGGESIERITKYIENNTLQVALQLNGISKSIETEIAQLGAKPNDADALADWEEQNKILSQFQSRIGLALEFFDTGDNAIVVKEPNAVAEEIAAIGTEFRSWLSKNRPEMVDWFLRLGPAIMFTALASSAGASMAIATPMIFGMACGAKGVEIYRKIKGLDKPKE